MSLILYTFMVSPFQQNARVLVDTDLSEALIIDPGDEVEKLFSVIKDYNIKKTTLFLTHCHIDHAGGVKPLLDLFQKEKLIKPSLMYHRFELPVGAFIEQYAVMSGLGEGHYFNAPYADVFIEDQAPFFMGDLGGVFIFSPGHSPGHMALYFENIKVSLKGAFSDLSLIDGPVLIGGDALFLESIGRTDLPGGNYQQLIEAIKTRFFVLPENTVVFTGHGPSTTIGYEKACNPFFK